MKHHLQDTSYSITNKTMQALSNLPVHALPMDQPPPSEILTDDSGHDACRWLLTGNERARIAQMLDTERKFDLKNYILYSYALICIYTY